MDHRRREEGDPLRTLRESLARPGDILLFYRGTGVGRLISWFTRSPFYHVALYAGGRHAIEARPGGVIRRDLCSDKGGKHFVVIPAPGGAGPEALAWAEQRVGAPYALLKVLAVVLDELFEQLHWNPRPRGRFSCAGLVARAYEAAGHPLFPDADVVVPADFARFLPTGGMARAPGRPVTGGALRRG